MSANNKTHPQKPASNRVGLNPKKEVAPVKHNTTWDEKVARGRMLVTEINDRKWELGDLANEVCPANAHGVNDGGRLEAFATEIGLTAATLRKYRMVATAWVDGTRVPSQTWTTHRMLAERDDRFEIIAEQIWTYNSLSTRLGRLPNPSRTISDAQQAGFDADPETPDAEQIVDAIRSNPDVAQAAAAAIDYASPEVKRSLHQRLSSDPDVKPSGPDEFDRRYAEAEREEKAARKGRGDFRHIAADALLIKAKRAVKEALEEIHEAALTEEHVDLLRHRANEVNGLVGLFLVALTGAADVDWDAELATLMGGE